MTNEQLAGLIGEGGNDELLPLLWDKVRKLMYMHADRYFRLYSDNLSAYGITSQDLKQASYSAFLKAIEGYCKSDKSYKFTSFFKYPFKNAVRVMLTKDTLNTAASLNIPVGEDGEEKELLDYVPDSSSLESFEQIENKDVYAVLNKAVDTLPEREQDILKQHYYGGKTYKSIAEQYNISDGRIGQLEARALKTLRMNKEVRRLGKDLGYGSSRIYHNSAAGFARTGITNVERIAIQRADMDKNFIKMLLEYKERLQAIRAAGETKQSFHDNNISISFYNTLVSSYQMYGIKLDEDETNINGEYLVQMLRYMER